MVRTKDSKKELEPVTRDYTLNMHKRLQNIQFKKRAPRALREIARFAATNMHTQVSTFFVASNLNVLFLGCQNRPTTQ